MLFALNQSDAVLISKWNDRISDIISKKMKQKMFHKQIIIPTKYEKKQLRKTLTYCVCVCVYFITI